jgi:catechol 2,3-dioxygenase-like lactoylglutathione lyase family enzyme
MDHVGVVVGDLAAAKAFFLAVGFELVGEWAGEGEVVDRIVGLEGVQTDVAMVQAPGGQGRLELIRFRSPAGGGGDGRAPANAPGLRHLALEVDDIQATLARLAEHGAELVGAVEDAGGYRLCYVRGPEGVIVELAERVG